MDFQKSSETEETKRFWQILTIIAFMCFMIAGFVVGLFFFARPKTSEIEKRTLTEYPEFTWGTFMTGGFTSDLSTWYADTYPGREKMMSAEHTLKLLYGVRNDAGGNVANGDEIPDILPDPSKDEPETTPVETSSEAETVAPTKEPETVAPSTEEPTKETVVETLSPEELESQAQALLRMNPQTAGAVNVKDLVGYCVYGFNLKAADRYCEAVAALRNATDPSVKFYEMLAPDNSAVLLDDATKKEWNLSDEGKVIAYYTSKINQLCSGVTSLDLLSTLTAHKNEYIYFKTDHHWTALGAYYAYTAFCKAAGLTPEALDSYETTVSEVFTGSYVHTNGFKQLEANADSITYYIPHATNTITFYDTAVNKYRTGNAVRNMSAFHVRYGYMGFIWGDNPYSYMENPTLKNGKVCLLIKDSYGNCFAPFLIDHYERVVIVDYRYYESSIAELIKDEHVTDVIFLNNLDAIANKSNMDVLYERCK